MTQSPPINEIPRILPMELIERYEVLLIDAYGVLIHRDGPIPGAVEFVNHLNDTNHTYFILTNDASRSHITAAANLQRKGFSIPPEHVITSGSLVVPYFAEHNLAGSKCVVFGPHDSKEYIKQAGGIVVDPNDATHVDVVVACDDAGYPFLETIEATLSLLFRQIDAGHDVKLLLPNPDLIYQKNEREVGLTAGSVALLIEHALQIRYFDRAPSFVRLGKPHTPIYEEAFQRCNNRNMVMIGDQLRTDILGANTYGIDSVLVDTGLTQLADANVPDSHRPSFLLSSLKLPS